MLRCTFGPHLAILTHYNDVIMSAVASQITSVTIVYPTVYSGEDQWKHQSSASVAFVRGIHRWPVNSPRKGPVTRKVFPFDDVIMSIGGESQCGPDQKGVNFDSRFILNVKVNQPQKQHESKPRRFALIVQICWLEHERVTKYRADTDT